MRMIHDTSVLTPSPALLIGRRRRLLPPTCCTVRVARPSPSTSQLLPRVITTPTHCHTGAAVRCRAAATRRGIESGCPVVAHVASPSGNSFGTHLGLRSEDSPFLGSTHMGISEQPGHWHPRGVCVGWAADPSFTCSFKAESKGERPHWARAVGCAHGRRASACGATPRTHRRRHIQVRKDEVLLTTGGGGQVAAAACLRRHAARASGGLGGKRSRGSQNNAGVADHLPI